MKEGGSGWLAAPTWLVDASELRSLLDRLRDAIALPPVARVNTGEVLMHDRGAIAASLRAVLDQLALIDLTATRALSGVVREYRSDADARHLRALFDSLEDALRARVLAVLGQAKVSAVARLLSSPAPDVLRILGREDDENSHSDLIAWLLNPRKAPTVALHALRRLTSHLPDAASWFAKVDDAVSAQCVSVRRELVLARELWNGDDMCRVDIVVSGPGFLLAIENKVWSTEHSDQTRTYWSWMETCTGLTGGLFLSPSGHNATCPSFQAVSYLDLVSALVEGPTNSALTQSEEIVLASYLKTLARGTIPVEMRAVRELASSQEKS